MRERQAAEPEEHEHARESDDRRSADPEDATDSRAATREDRPESERSDEARERENADAGYAGGRLRGRLHGAPR